MTTTGKYELPTYGNWREPRTAGIGKLNFAGALALFIGVFISLITMLVADLLAAVAVFGVAVVVLAMVAVRGSDGLTVAQRVGARAAFSRSRSAGSNLYRSGPLGRTQWGENRLPGVLARSSVTQHEDSFGRPFAVVSYPRSSHSAIVLVAEPPGLSGLDPQHVDDTVAAYGGFLTALGLEPDVVAAAVTIETAPDPGLRFQREVNLRLSPSAPEFARQVMAETLELGGAGSSTVRAWVTITFRRDSGRRTRDVATFGRQLAVRVPHFVRSLAATGAGGIRPATAQDLCEMVRTAYDPAASRGIEENTTAGERQALSWEDVGPAAAEARWGDYVHDSGRSITWTMSSAPRGSVYSNVLSSLLAPTAGVARKRVTLLYQPLSAAAAAKVVESDLRNARNAASNARASARAVIELDSAKQTAVEEAQGSGLVDFGMVVTATLEQDSDVTLEELRHTIQNSSAPARVRLRIAYGAQDSAFAAGLPVGLVLPSLVNAPKAIQELGR